MYEDEDEYMFFSRGVGGGEVRPGYSDFCLLQGLGVFFGVQNFEFRYFLGCRGFVNYFMGMPI